MQIIHCIDGPMISVPIRMNVKKQQFHLTFVSSSSVCLIENHNDDDNHSSISLLNHFLCCVFFFLLSRSLFDFFLPLLSITIHKIKRNTYTHSPHVPILAKKFFHFSSFTLGNLAHTSPHRASRTAVGVCWGNFSQLKTINWVPICDRFSPYGVTRATPLHSRIPMVANERV
jgi:hypothetical protein